MDQLNIIFRDDVPNRLPSIIQKAKEGSLEAQYVCWETFNLHLKSDPKLEPDPELFWYVSASLSSIYDDGEKIESLLPFYKDKGKYKEDLKRMLRAALFIQTLKDIKKEKDCTNEEAEEFLVNIAMKNCSNDPVKHPEGTSFRRINSRDKLKMEIRYYHRNYPKWAFYLDGYLIEGLPFKIKSAHKIPVS